MSLKDKHIPNETNYIKLKDFPDGEKITIVSAGLNEEAKFGPQPYFLSVDGDRITLPTRYADYILDIINTPESMAELRKGMVIIKSSRETQNGGSTPTFTFE